MDELSGAGHKDRRVAVTSMANDQKTTSEIECYKNGVQYRRCPHCGKLKPIEDFGYRAMTPGGKVREQSWCKECR